MRIPGRLLVDDEHILLQCRRHGAVLVPALVWAMVLAGLVGLAVAALEPRRAAVVAAGAVALWLVTSGRAVLRWWFTVYVLTTDRVLLRRGWRWRAATVVPLDDVASVQVEQRARGRLLGYGDVLIGAAWREGDVRLADVADPEGVRAEIHRARARRLSELGDPAAGRELVRQLEALADLRERGHLSDEEFAAEKRRLLTDPTA